jgi:hypothetical protein
MQYFTVVPRKDTEYLADMDAGDLSHVEFSRDGSQESCKPTTVPPGPDAPSSFRTRRRDRFSKRAG